MGYPSPSTPHCGAPSSATDSVVTAATRPPANPRPPRHLSARARRLWRDLHEEYDLSLAASALLLGGLEMLDTAELARRQIASDGLLVAGRYATSPRAHPLAAVRRDALRTAERVFRALDLELSEDAGAQRPAGGRAAPGPMPMPSGRARLGLLAAVGEDQ